MKRVVRSKSGREIYGPKWVNNNKESSNSCSSESENRDIVHSVSIEATETAPVSLIETNVVDSQDATQMPEGISRRGNRVSDCHETMYRATLEGDWVAAEMLLEGDPKLGSDEISEEGDRALHVAASMKHKDFVLKLVERMTPSELEMLDGRGYTAFCYAAVSGSIEIANLMIRKNPTLATARDRENKTPLQKAALRRNTKMVSYLLKSTKIENLSKDEWFDLLLVTIRGQMYGVALEILGSDEQLSTMRNDEGTALHLLARQCYFIYSIERLGQATVIELMKNPSILHHAAEEGNVELITMLTQAYPNLVWHTDNKGYTIFHIAAKYRYYHLFELINEIGARKDFIANSQDADGNNILHLAAELVPPERSWYLVMTAFQMHMEVLWFKKVKETVPPLCWEMRNKEGDAPKELFIKRHDRLLEESKIWITNTADSCMLISTLIFSVVFASTFAVPGGYNQLTGIPVLYKTKSFTCFVIFEALAMFSSALCIVCFLRIMMMGYGKIGSVLRHLLIWFLLGLGGLAFSVLGAISAFMSAYFLVYTKERAALVESVILILYVVIIVVACIKLLAVFMALPKRFLRKQTRHTLFKRPHAVTAKRRWFWIL